MSFAYLAVLLWGHRRPQGPQGPRSHVCRGQGRGYGTGCRAAAARAAMWGSARAIRMPL